MDGISKKPYSQPVQQQFAPKTDYRQTIYISKDEAAYTRKKRLTFMQRRRLKKVFFFATSLLILIALLYGFFFLWKAYAVSKKMNSDDPQSTSLTHDLHAMISPIIPTADTKPLNGQQDGRINILLMGAAGEHNPGSNLTDTIMVMSVDTQNKKIALLSIPRDLYVNIPDTQSYTKINSLYQIGLHEGQGADLIRQKMEEITGLKVNYYLALDFDGFSRIIDQIGGVNVTVARDMYDARYPGPNYSYQTFSITKGFHTLDGDMALKYVRERHDDPQGDFGRALRQQQVIQAVKNKLFSIQTLFNVVAMNNIMDTLGDNIKTDISFDDIGSFINLSKQVDTQNITNVVVDAWKPDSLLKATHVQIGNASAFALLPRVGSYSEIQDLAKNIFDQDQLKKRHQAIMNEQAKVGIINESGDTQLAQKVQQLLTNELGIKNTKVISKSNKELAAETQVSDNTNGGKLFTLDEIIKKLPASLASSANQYTDSNYDMVITLGRDIVETYTREEASLDEYTKAQDNQDNMDPTIINK